VRRSLIVTALVVMIAGRSHAQATMRGTCLHFEPDTVQLTGRLERRMYYGPPNFGEDPAHDAKEVGLYLALAAPVCAAGGGDPELDTPQRSVRRVQLVLDSAGYAQMRPLVGQRVRLRGTLFAAHTGHHHTPILLTVLTPVDARP
jgi:hypothetical protein